MPVPPGWRGLPSLLRQPIFLLTTAVLSGTGLGWSLLQQENALLVSVGLTLFCLGQWLTAVRSIHWKVILGASLIALLLVIRNAPPAPMDWDIRQDWAPREVILEIEWLRIHSDGVAGSDRGFGMARIAKPPQLYPEWQNRTLRVTFLRPPEVLLRGSTWRVTGLLTPRPVSPEAVPGSSVSPQRMQEAGSLRVRSGVQLDSAPPLVEGFSRVRQKLESQLLGGDPENPARGLLCTLLLGNRNYMDSTTSRILRETGTFHFFAISGLHIGLIGGLFWGLMRLVPLRNSMRGGFVLAGLTLYLGIIDAPPSASRAVLMAGCFLAAGWFARPGSALCGLMLSICLHLLVWPGQWFDQGFRLSHLVVASILLYGEPLRWHTARLWERDPLGRIRRKSFGYQLWNGLFGMICISLAAFLASTPIIINLSGVAPWGGILLNPPLYVLIFAALTLGAVGLAFAALPASELFFQSATYCLDTGIRLAQAFHRWSGSRWENTWPLDGMEGWVLLSMTFPLLLPSPRQPLGVCLRLMGPPMVLGLWLISVGR